MFLANLNYIVKANKAIKTVVHFWIYKPDQPHTCVQKQNATLWKSLNLKSEDSVPWLYLLENILTQTTQIILNSLIPLTNVTEIPLKGFPLC